ncbi:hypothetical protein CT19431_40291 [Cupriavidus taiwanensis]|nr:hypothetical protein CT19431_40291 [Cupriavidus taiwanensis]
MANAGSILREPQRFLQARISLAKRERYSEPRYITVGMLDGRMVVMVWTTRGKARRIISMRKANEREQARYLRYLDGPR